MTAQSTVSTWTKFIIQKTQKKGGAKFIILRPNYVFYSLDF